MSSPKHKKDDVVWYDNLFLGWVQVRVLHNESAVFEGIDGKKIISVHAYTIESVETVQGEKRRWSLTPETQLYSSPNK
ncbi:MAG: hypothetical protein Q8L57_01695 [bacterium]|nr:hypothetical protein [bacterium]